ncbi:MAG: DUF1554 domain-containing protein [Candidatus Levybacteria bacterium]|nr:DUF1554 domain-containing protein [Candidatus Levybacteria bacterium]
MVALSITAVLGTLGIAGFTTYNQIQTLQAASSDVVSILNLAKSRAQSQIKPSGLCSATLDGYTVVINAPSSYWLELNCSDGNHPIIATQNKKLTANLNFSANISFFFPVQTGGVQTPGQIVITGFGRNKTIVINSLGGVSVLAGDLVPTPTPVPTSTPTPTSTPVVAKRVFVTSTVYNGNLGGLAGADAKCQTKANDAILGGTWKAWLSDSTNSPAQSLPPRPFTHSTSPYKLVNGTLVANDWNDLITDKSGNYLTNPIRRDESGINIADSVVWTGTNVSGNPVNSNNCSNWTSGSSSLSSVRGQNWQISQLWTSSAGTFCDVALHLYCFEQ